MTKWIKTLVVAEAFQLEGGPEVIYVIKTGFINRYMVIREGAYVIELGNIEFGTKPEIEAKFNITLSI